MVRPLGILVGLGFVASLMWCFLWGASAFVADPPQPTVQEEWHQPPKSLSYASDGPFGRFDRQQLQRGFQVYKEVCAACHSLRLVHFRDLDALGYTGPEIKAIAKQWQIEVPDINPDTGEASTRKALPIDHFPSPYPNEVAARSANNGALPPDLSLITKAREGGAPYVHSLLTGFQAPPADLPAEARPGPNLHYNPYFANLNIAMPPPLTADGQVTYADGTNPTVDQMAQDVSAFLIWTADPNLESRKSTGAVTVIFLIVASILAYLAYQNIWADVKPRKRLAKSPGAGIIE